MTIDDILAPADVIHGLRASDKTVLLGDLAKRAAQLLDLDAGAVFGALVRREDLGSTGVGDGVALPHARLEMVRKPFGLLARLRDPIDFDAVDERPVDLVFLLLLPTDEAGQHLNALACVARKLRNPDTAVALRRARDAAGLYALVSAQSLSEV